MIRTAIATAALGTALVVAAPASAAANLTYAAVKGQNAAGTASSGTIWYTGTSPAGNSNPMGDSGNYTLFVQQPVPTGAFLNSGTNGKTINDPTEVGQNNFAIFGEAFRPGETTPSDLVYELTLGFADGARITGQLFNGVFTQNASSSATVGGTAYTLNGFDWSRAGNAGSNDIVGAYTPGRSGQGPDYTGTFSFNTAAVPEPATWAMMVLGFGVVGFGMRRRKSVKTTVQFA